MKTKAIFMLIFAVTLVVVGCGGTSSQQSSALTFQMAVLQAEGDHLISGVVYNDINENQIMDMGEPGVPGALVTLVGVSDVITGTDGMFAFAVSAGAYTVHETDPAGYTSTTLNEFPVVIVDEDISVNFGDYMVLDLPVDVKPGSDISPLNLKSNGVLPVAILGSEDFDVALIDPASLLLNGVAPLRWSYEDVCGPDDMTIDPDEGSDNGETPDGYDDLTLKFSTPEIAATVGDVQRGDIVTLTMTGSLLDGSIALGEETVWIVQIPK